MTVNASADDGDHLTRFLLDRAGVRGVHVHLGDSWTQIRSRDDYPLAVAELLGEATAAAALFTGHAKIDGRLSVQLRGQGRLRTLFAECTAAGTLRGIAQLAEGDVSPVSRDLRELGAGAMLAITIESRSAAGREPMRYQGIVALEADSLAAAFEQYFRQSEQLPTRLLLAADEQQAAGLMLQKLPGDEGDEDGWNRASALFDTLKPGELLQWPVQTLLARLFHEDGVRLLGDKPLRFACSCSRERVAAMLESLGPDEARAAVIGGSAHVRCEFCGQAYEFTGDEVDALFSRTGPEIGAPGALQ
ncbi:Hsp33 family molecular chaperone HslO [Luteimonas mephitis]|uniref:Hsp33 family molecular chaperone HslO n=1 Tax=Luteimonas mephitis TaxID=83615 RepID=UPI000403A484|nr:Hsp33 family molecular chaperone HslO [Luteimonas mephitis]